MQYENAKLCVLESAFNALYSLCFVLYLHENEEESNEKNNPNSVRHDDSSLKVKILYL